MRLFAWAALAACICAAPTLAAPQISALGTPAAPTAAASDPQAAAAVRVAMRQETLPPGGSLPEHRQSGERYLYVVAGRLKVSNLVTGEEQVVEAGKMAAEQPGDWHVAVALGAQAATFYVIDRGPADGAATTAANNDGN
ncbi:MAG TPA: cupin domain-containing protein [Phenylobacterium sp.]|uniref:cupin domain-containing protein n=1 Tax=Phenylobacterium sp. TaxID=1871053 RepID=UPI002B45C8CE|nr:cupin domain-containing protein [Phenylobacterium sp.]HKR90067.1 cupin domain-containing protein [Phenylobacterium sp.]